MGNKISKCDQLNCRDSGTTIWMSVNCSANLIIRLTFFSVKFLPYFVSNCADSVGTINFPYSARLFWRIFWLIKLPICQNSNVSVLLAYTTTWRWFCSISWDKSLNNLSSVFVFINFILGHLNNLGKYNKTQIICRFSFNFKFTLQFQPMF